MRTQQNMSYRWREKAASREAVICLFAHMNSHSSLPLIVRREYYENGSDTGPHKHVDFYALYVVEAGQGVHLIDEHPYGITRGDVYVLPPGTVHAYRDYNGLEIDAFYFQPWLFSDEERIALQELSGFWHLLISPNEEHIPIDKDETVKRNEFVDHRLHLPPERHYTVEQMTDELRSEFLTPSKEAVQLTRGLFFRLLVHLSRWQEAREIMPTEKQGESAIERDGRGKPGIARILQICEERYCEPLTVPQLAAYMFLSPSRFTELFSHEVGMSPGAYIRRLRLERAQTLLRTTTISTTKIAHQVGFSDGAQFSRAFRAMFRLTPTAYRATFR